MTPHNKPDKQTKPHKTDANMNYLDSAENQEMSALLNDTESSLEAELDCEYGQLNSAPYRKYIFTFSRSIEMGRQRFCSAISCRRVATVFVAAYFLAWVSFGKRSFGNHGAERGSDVDAHTRTIIDNEIARIIEQRDGTLDKNGMKALEDREAKIKGEEQKLQNERKKLNEKIKTVNKSIKKVNEETKKEDQKRKKNKDEEAEFKKISEQMKRLANQMDKLKEEALAKNSSQTDLDHITEKIVQIDDHMKKLEDEAEKIEKQENPKGSTS